MPDEAMPLYLIHDARLEQASRDELSALATVHFIPWADRESVPAGSRVLLFLGDEQIRDISLTEEDRQWEVGVLPHPEGREAMAALGVKGDLVSVFTHYLDAEPER